MEQLHHQLTQKGTRKHRLGVALKAGECEPGEVIMSNLVTFYSSAETSLVAFLTANESNSPICMVQQLWFLVS